MQINSRLNKLLARMPKPIINRLPCVYIKGIDPEPDKGKFSPIIAVETAEQKEVLLKLIESDI